MTNRTAPPPLAVGIEPQPEDGHDEFEIAAIVSLHEQRPRTLKHNDTFAVFDHTGNVSAYPNSSEGLYHRDIRHLSQFHLTICGGIRPILLSSSLRDDSSTLTCDLTNPDIVGGNGKLILQNDLIHVRRTRFICNGRLYERLTLTNYQDKTGIVACELQFASDFADLFEVRGAVRKRRGRTLPPSLEDDRILLGYIGLDGITRCTRLTFDPAPEHLTPNLAIFRFELPPHKSSTVSIEVACEEPETHWPLRHRLIHSYRAARNDLRANMARAPSLVSSNEIFNQTVQRCVTDIYMLLTQTDFGPYPYAGIPWYSTVFGRDALITALEMLWFDPAIARGVLRYLAANQARDFDSEADAEPGKILHEVRHGEMANLKEVPFGRYYGSIDATPLFILLAGAYLRRTGDIETVNQIWPNIAAALAWIDLYGDRDRDGYVEYGRMSAEGLINQGWKDSHDSVFHADGDIAAGPIALAEVQAYVYGAWQAAAAILERRQDSDQAEVYRARAEDLRRRFDADFFDEELGTYVLALDGEKKPCRVRSSNAGQVLFTGLALHDRVPRIVETLLAVTSFSGWGIRTVAAGEARYNPMSYHNGSIWPHDNALIAAGFARYGFRRECARIFEGLFAASTYVDLRRLPELFCGFVRRPANSPTFYPVSCVPQAWSAAAPLSLIQSSLGLTFDDEKRSLQFDQPMLPPFLDDLTIKRLAIGNEWVDLRLHRSGAKVLVEVLDRKGDLQIFARI